MKLGTPLDLLLSALSRIDTELEIRTADAAAGLHAVHQRAIREHTAETRKHLASLRGYLRGIRRTQGEVEAASSRFPTGAAPLPAPRFLGIELPPFTPPTAVQYRADAA